MVNRAAAEQAGNESREKASWQVLETVCRMGRLFCHISSRTDPFKCQGQRGHRRMEAGPMEVVNLAPHVVFSYGDEYVKINTRQSAG